MGHLSHSSRHTQVPVPATTHHQQGAQDHRPCSLLRGMAEEADSRAQGIDALTTQRHRDGGRRYRLRQDRLQNYRGIRADVVPYLFRPDAQEQNRERLHAAAPQMQGRAGGRSVDGEEQAHIRDVLHCPRDAQEGEDGGIQRQGHTGLHRE